MAWIDNEGRIHRDRPRPPPPQPPRPSPPRIRNWWQRRSWFTKLLIIGACIWLISSLFSNIQRSNSTTPTAQRSTAQQTSTQQTSTQQSATTTTVTVTSSGLNLRAQPSSNARIVKTLRRGDVLTVTGSLSRGWMPVAHGGDRGWVDPQFTSSRSNSSAQNQATQQQTTTTGAVPLVLNQYAGSNFTSSIQSRTFSFPVTNGTRYNVWLDDWDQNRSNVDALISARYSGGANIFTDVDIAYPQQFTANRTGTVILTITTRTRGQTGNFRVGYN